MFKKKYYIIALFCAVSTALLCAILRVNAITKIDIPLTHPKFTAFYIVMAICILLSFAFSQFLGGRVATQEKTTARKIFAAVSSVLLLVAAGLNLVKGTPSGMQIVSSIFLVACSASQIVGYFLSNNEAKGIASLFPVYYLCFFLLMFYRANARIPQTYSFAIEIFVIVSLLLSVYIISSCRFEKRKTRRVNFFCLTAVFFSALHVFSVVLLPDYFLGVQCIDLSATVMIAAFGLISAAGVIWPSPQIISIEPAKAPSEFCEDEPLPEDFKLSPDEHSLESIKAQIKYEDENTK